MCTAYGYFEQKNNTSNWKNRAIKSINKINTFIQIKKWLKARRFHYALRVILKQILSQSF